MQKSPALCWWSKPIRGASTYAVDPRGGWRWCRRHLKGAHPPPLSLPLNRAHPHTYVIPALRLVTDCITPQRESSQTEAGRHQRRAREMALGRIEAEHCVRQEVQVDLFSSNRQQSLLWWPSLGHRHSGITRASTEQQCVVSRCPHPPPHQQAITPPHLLSVSARWPRLPWALLELYRQQRQKIRHTEGMKAWE